MTKCENWRCHRITVSTQDFHSCNRGSIPLGTTSRELRLNMNRDYVAHVNFRRALALPKN